MKGITPIIAIILLLVIIIVVVGFSFVVFQEVIETSGSAATNTIEEQSGRAASCMRLESVAGNIVYVRNCGNTDLEDFSVYIGDAPVGLLSADSVPPNSVGAIQIDLSGLGLPPGNYPVRIGSSSLATDQGTFYIETSMPVVILDYPQDDQQFTAGENVEFHCTADDPDGLQTFELYTNTSGTWQVDCSDPAPDTHGDILCTLPAPSEGEYRWNCKAVDTGALEGWGVERTIIVNPPGELTVYLDYPEDWHDFEGEPPIDVTLECHATDGGSVDSLELIFDGSAHPTCFDGGPDDLNAQDDYLRCIFSYDIESEYTWNCEATDDEFNTVTGVERWFTVTIGGLGGMLGAVTDTAATINVINRFGQEADFKIEYTPAAIYDPRQTSEITNVVELDVAEFRLTDLTVGEWKYKIMYDLGSGYQYGPERTFQTQRPQGETFNFALFTDTHLNDASNARFDRCVNVNNEIRNKDETVGVDLSFVLGDNIMSKGVGTPDAADGTDFDKRYQNLRRCTDIAHSSIPLHAIIGNWEGEDGYTKQEIFDNATNNRTTYIPNPDETIYPESGSVREDYFAFTWGDALFVVLNVQGYTPVYPAGYMEDGWPVDGTVFDWTLGQDQLDWFEQTLQNSNEKWKFAFIHHDAGGNVLSEHWTKYGRGGARGSFVGEQEVMHRLMKDNGVYAMFYGHDHLFFDMTIDGIHYTMPGTAGYFPFSCDGGYSQTGNPCWDDQNDAFGYAFVEVGTTQVDVSFLTQYDDLVYQFTINERSGDVTLPVITHTPVTEAFINEDIVITADVTDVNPLGPVYLYYKNAEDYLFRNIVMMVNTVGDTYEQTIPGDFLYLNETFGIEYFIHAEDEDGNNISTSIQEIVVKYHQALLENNDIVDYIIKDTCVRHTPPLLYEDCELIDERLSLFAGAQPPTEDYIYRAYIDFDTTIIPDTSEITQVNFSFREMAVQEGTPELEITKMLSLGSSYVDLMRLYTDIGNADMYETIALVETAVRYDLDLGATASSDLESQLITENWFSIGLREDEEAALYEKAAPGSEDRASVSFRPILVVEYYIP
ncbi:metallophosphoesterase family protein [Candidatus Aenigmatarchaeota archaeon]